MDRLLIGVEAQAGFPAQDLSGANAERLALWLSNQELLDVLHTSAEDTRPLYRFGHAAIAAILRTSEQFSEEQLAAIGYGIVAHEAMSVAVATEAQPDVENPLGQTELIVVQTVAELESVSAATLDELGKAYLRQQPHTAGVVGEVADRFTPSYRKYTLAGAALSRHIELKAA